MPDQLLIGGVCQNKPVFRTLKERGKIRRPDKHLPEAANLLTLFEYFRGRNLHHWPILPEGVPRFPLLSFGYLFDNPGAMFGPAARGPR
jgi:hypothetical protein